MKKKKHLQDDFLRQFFSCMIFMNLSTAKPYINIYNTYIEGTNNYSILLDYRQFIFSFSDNRQIGFCVQTTIQQLKDSGRGGEDI